MELKVDPKFPHHYIIGVEVKSAISSDAGELFLKYGPVYFTNKEVGKLRDAKILSEDKLFRTTIEEATEIQGCSELVYNLWALQMSAHINNCSVHHFSSEYELDDEVFETLVKAANFSKETKKLLDKSRIRR